MALMPGENKREAGEARRRHAGEAWCADTDPSSRVQAGNVAAGCVPLQAPVDEEIPADSHLDLKTFTRIILADRITYEH